MGVSRASESEVDGDPNQEEQGLRRTTRRALMVGGAAGVAGLVGGSLLGAKPAGATQGQSVLLGENNTNPGAATTVTYSSTTVGALADGVNGWGVSGTGTRAGLYGTDAGTGIGSGLRVLLSNTANASTAAQITTVGNGVALLVQGEGTGSVFEAVATSKSNANPVVSANTQGNGPAFNAASYGTGFTYYGSDVGAGTGGGLNIQLANAANPSAAIEAGTAGTGTVLQGYINNAKSTAPVAQLQTNGTGYGIFVNSTNASSTTSPAIYVGSEAAIGLEVAVYSATTPAMAVVASTAGSGAAVYAITSGTGTAVTAENTSATNGEPAVYGSTAGTYAGVAGAAVKASAAGVLGTGSNGATGVKGVTDTGMGVYGDAETSGQGVFGNSNSGVGVYASSYSGAGLYATSATSSAIQAIAQGGNGSALQATAAGTGVAVFARSTGTGAGLYTDDGGTGTGGYLEVDISNPNNASPAVFVENAGKGNSLQINQSAKTMAAAISVTSQGTGSAVDVQLLGAGNTVPAVSGYNGSTAGVGVQGEAAGSQSIGVVGVATTGGTGVRAYSDSGVAVSAQSGTGTALLVDGKISLSRSGVALVPAGSSSVGVTLAGLTPGSLVFANIQQPAAGLAVSSCVSGTTGFTIYLTAKTTGQLPVAWFVVN